MDLSGLELGFISGEQNPHLRNCLFKITEAGRLKPHGLHRTISEANADDESFRRELFKRRVRAGDNRRMSCHGIRDAGADPDLRCIQGDGCHVDERFAPDQMGIADPHMAVAEVLTELRKPDHFLERFRWEQSNAKVQRAHSPSFSYWLRPNGLEFVAAHGLTACAPLLRLRAFALALRPGLHSQPLMFRLAAPLYCSCPPSRLRFA